MEVTIKNLLNSKRLLVLVLCFGVFTAGAQGWKPANNGLFPIQYGGLPDGFNVKFKENLGGKDWIYGGYWDSDSLRRNVAYREGGKWVSLPFSGYHGNMARDIEMYGDTLYILGSFGNLVQDNGGAALPITGLIKWFNDSLWTANDKVQIPNLIISAFNMSTKGDSLLVSGGSYYDTTQLIHDHFMSSDGGQSWQYPYSIIHPTETIGYFGATRYKAEILPNGDILTLNNGSPPGNPYLGLARWDGQQWHSYGSGLSGTTSKAFDFEFYQGQLYMGGTFWKSVFPNDPGDFIVRWNGQDWEEFANGVNGFVSDMFEHESILYTFIDGGPPDDHQFGDVKMQYFAGWDGHQWCGTPSVLSKGPRHFGFINDTLYVSFGEPAFIDGDSVGYMAYFDGDYLNGPDAICSTFGLGEKNLLDINQLTIFPNPVEDIFTISMGIEPLEELKIFDLQGRCVLYQHYNKVMEPVQISVPDLKAGAYLMKINGSYNQKFIKL